MPYIKHEDTVCNPIQEDPDEPISASAIEISMEATAAAAAAAASLQFEDVAEAAGVNIVDPDTAYQMTTLAHNTIKGIGSEHQDIQDVSLDHDDSMDGDHMTSSADSLEKRRRRDRQKYANMSNEERMEYNFKRRAQYHRQSDLSRKKRRERERRRYHALTPEEAKERNERRAAMERERYKSMSKDELEERNKRRRERAAQLRREKSMNMNGQSADHMEDAVKEATEAAFAAAVTTLDIMETSEVQI
jgi:hypothetical protein